MFEQSAVLKFQRSLIEKPIVSRAIKETDVEVNILQAHVTPEEDGQMFVIFRGTRDVVDRAIAYLRDQAVTVILPTKNLFWIEDRCVHCTACVGQCPSAAFTVDPPSGEVRFDGGRCIGCKLCIPACSYAALESVGDRLHRTGEL